MSAPQNHAQEKQKVAAFSLLASAVMAIAKFAAALFSGSLGLLSEAFQTLLDVLATTLTLFAVRVSDKPADDEHHYGHAKVENIAALLQTVMLFGVAVYVAFEAVSRLFAGDHEIKLQWWLYAVVIGSILIDYNRYRALKRTAVKTGSAALAADAVHFAADMWSSLAVLLGLILVWFGFTYADSVAALVVTGFVTHAAWELGKQTLNNLLDAAPAGAVAQITDVVDTVDGVLSIRQLRVRPAGPTLFVDLTVDVPRTLPVMQLDSMRQELAKRIAGIFENADSSIQLNPVELDSETAFDKVSMIAEKHGLKTHHLAVQKLGGRLAVSFDVEMNADISLLAAHDKATALEAEIRGGLGADVEVESHIEPLEPRLLEGAPPAPALTTKIQTTLMSLARREKQLSDLHNVRIRSNAAGLYVHYHCRFDPALAISDVHAVTDRIEVALMAALPNIKRVVAHAEPVGHSHHEL
jgi:cation diffusion facilitator family transporter